MKVSELIAEIEAIAPLNLQEPWDNSGYQIGDPDSNIKGVLTALEVNDAVVKEAIDLECNLIICHHPIFFHPVRKIIPEYQHYQIIRKAIISGITIYAAHTNFDAACGGVNTSLAQKLSLVDVQPLTDHEGNYIGVVGNLESPMDAELYLKHVKSLFGVYDVKYSTPPADTILRIAICGGAGGSFLKEVIEQKADAYLSADFKYHDFATAENKILITDIGHYESEIHTKELFYNIVNEKKSNFAVHMSNVNTNSVNHL